MTKTLEEKMMTMIKKKSQEKQARWKSLQEDEKRKDIVEERIASAKEKRAMAELIAEENATMGMDPSSMDSYTRELWDLVRMEILQRRRESAMSRASQAISVGGPDSGAGGGGASGVGGVGGDYAKTGEDGDA